MLPGVCLSEVAAWRCAPAKCRLYADKTLGVIYDGLEASGVLDNAWLVFTSDHGQMFEELKARLAEVSKPYRRGG